MKSRRSKACDIPQKVKDKVFERDKGECVWCHNTVNVMPSAHYLSRAHGGLGVEENILTLCTDFTERKCHDRYDHGMREERAEMKEKFRNYLKEKYPYWDEKFITYRKWSDGK